MKMLAVFIPAIFASATCLASPINTVASDPAVQSLVTAIATQSLSGDAVYCGFDFPREINLQDTPNGLNYQVEIDCGSGADEKHHMNDRKMFVKGFIEDSQVFVTGVQLNKKL